MVILPTGIKEHFYQSKKCSFVAVLSIITVQAGKIMDKSTYTIKIDLYNLEELFSQPGADPFDPDSRFISGIDEVVEQLQFLSPRQRREQHILITLPQQLNKAELEEKTRAALQRYCRAKVEQSQRELDKVRQKAPRALLYSLVIVFIGISLGAVVLNAGFLSDTIQVLLSNGLTIFAWVALWEPAGIYLYEWLPLARDKHLYLLLKELELSLEFRS